MEKRIIYRSPRGTQDRFVIATKHVGTQNVQRGLELCEDLYLNQVGESGLLEERTSWEKVALQGKNFSPEQMRAEVYGAILHGAVGVEYDEMCDRVIRKDCKKGPWYDYLKELNYRITQCGRTLMALTCIAVYEDVVEGSRVLTDQKLPEDCVVGEFEDYEGNRYLMYQNINGLEKKPKIFSLELKKSFRIYRVNPHDGKQMLSKDAENVQKIMIMPGDADLLRYQDTEDDAYLIEYVLKK